MQSIKQILTRLSLAMFVLLGPATASAVSACKGMQQDACATKAECLWVDGYTRKDGRSVSAHCKTRSGGRSAGQADPGKVKLGHVK